MSITFQIVIIYAGRRYIAMVASLPVNATELQSGNDYASNVGNLVIPDWTGSRYIVIGQPQGLDDLESITLGGGGNSIADFAKANYTVTVDGVAHEIWISDMVQGNVIQGFTLMVS